MFIVPINTDAPLYHFPWATISLIVANVLVFLGVSIGGVPVDSYLLTYGQGLHPLQWLTSLFLHDGFLHLAGNLFFLWGFGLIVEGKLGWRRFLLAYLSLGVMESAVEQICLQHAVGASLGASSAIVGLMMMALIWAPRNEITFAYGILFPVFRAGTFDLTVLTFSLLYVALEVVVSWWLGLHAGTAVLHLLGGLLGLGLGTALLQKGIVDCEGWDLYSVWKGTHRRSTMPDRDNTLAAGQSNRRNRHASRGGRSANGRGEAPAAGIATLSGSGSRSQKARHRIQALLRQGKPRAALREWNDLRHLVPDAQLKQPELHELAQGLFAAELWQDAVALSEEYVLRFPEESDGVRIQTAGVLLKKLGRPKAALQMIEPVRADSVSQPARIRCRQIAASARLLIDSGVVELSGSPP